MPGSHQSSLLNGSQWVSESVTDKGRQWSNSGPIKIYWNEQPKHNKWYPNLNMSAIELVWKEILINFSAAVCKDWSGGEIEDFHAFHLAQKVWRLNFIRVEKSKACTPMALKVIIPGMASVGSMRSCWTGSQPASWWICWCCPTPPPPPHWSRSAS